MRLLLANEADQIAFGRRLARALSEATILYLEGDLGTGKTTLVRGLLGELGYRGPVRSPTYTLLEPYALPGFQLYHLDLYRLGDPEELEFLGIRDLLEVNSVLVIEWPQRGRGVLPEPDVLLACTHHPGGRQIQIYPRSSIGEEYLARLADSEPE